MSKIIEYKIVEGELAVNKLLIKGWQPIGGVSFGGRLGIGGTYKTLYQAMVRFEEEPEPKSIPLTKEEKELLKHTLFDYDKGKQ